MKKFDQLADRTIHLQPEGAYAVLAKANELENSEKRIIHLEIGQPDFQTFENISRAGSDAIMRGETRYTPSAGIPALKKEIAKYTGNRLNMKFSSEEVVVGPGAKPLLFFPMMALLEPGDEAIYPDPGFPSYRSIIETMGAKPVPIPLRESKNFSFDLEELEEKVNPNTRLLIINSPSNPTGGVIPENDLKKLADLAEKFDFWVLSDEIYTRLVYSGEPVASICQIPGMKKRTIIMDGFSKTYAMTGWRLGYGIMPEKLADKVGLLMTHSVGCTASFTQIAGIEALSGPQEQVEDVKATFKKRRDIIVDGLNAIPGITCLRPDGAFYVFPNIKSFGRSSEKIAELLLSEAGVALLPGTSFGENGEGYLRLCYATSIDEIEEALSKIKNTIIKLN